MNILQIFKIVCNWLHHVSKYHQQYFREIFHPNCAATHWIRVVAHTLLFATDPVSMLVYNRNPLPHLIWDGKFNNSLASHAHSYNNYEVPVILKRGRELNGEEIFRKLLLFGLEFTTTKPTSLHDYRVLWDFPSAFFLFFLLLRLLFLSRFFFLFSILLSFALAFFANYTLCNALTFCQSLLWTSCSGFVADWNKSITVCGMWMRDTCTFEPKNLLKYSK